MSAISPHQESINVVILYDQNKDDEKLLRKLEKHLSILTKQKVISIWHPQKIGAGTIVSETIEEQLRLASIILLLLSADFLASDYYSKVETENALERHKDKKALIVPILARSCDWEHTPFGILQPLPRSRKAITTWNDQDLAWHDVIIGLRKTIEDLHQGSVITEKLPRLDQPSSSNRAEPSKAWDVPHIHNPDFTGDNSFLDQHPSSDAPSIRHIHIEHAQGPVLGDHARVEQHFYGKLQQAPKDKKRRDMIKAVHARWIEDFLEPSLSGSPLLELELQDRSDLVRDPWHQVVQEMEYLRSSSLQKTSIIQMYDQAQGKLLIVGEPGTGKTMLLLELTRVLLDRAERDDDLPIPVVFHLSSWAEKRLPMRDWLIEELDRKYGISYKVGRTWIQEEKVLPLLDGLDEMNTTHIEACVRAINVYRQEHGLIPMVICSRQTEYTAQKERLLLRRAVVIQSLTDEQIDRYLSKRSEQREEIRKAIHSDHELRKIITPLILDILVRTYQGTNIVLPEADTIEERKEQLFAAYVQRMLQRREKITRYSYDQTIDWLAWLAKQMLHREQTEFYLERIQPDWLSKRWMHRLYYLVFRLPLGLLVLFAAFFFGGNLGLILGTFIGRLLSGEFGANVGWNLGATIGLFISSLCALWIFIIISWKQKIEIRPVDVTTWSWKRALQGFCIAFIGDFILEIIGWISHTANFVLVITTLGGFLLAGGIAWWATSTERRELLSWSWKHAKRAGIVMLVGSIFVYSLAGAISSLITDLGIALYKDYPYIELHVFGAPIVVPYLLSDTVAYGCVFGIVVGISHDMLDPRSIVKPNQGITRSLQYGIGTSSIFLILSLTDSYLSSYHDPSSVGIIILSGVFVGLLMGGYAAFQHGVLRLFLWRARCMPLRYTQFLDYATSRLLLRRVGGGYIFVHRLLLDYIATRSHAVPSIRSSSEGKRIRASEVSPFASRKFWIILSSGILCILSLVSFITIPFVKPALDRAAATVTYPTATEQAHNAALIALKRTWKLQLNDPLADNTKGYKWSENQYCQFLQNSYHAIAEGTAYFTACEAEATNFSNFVYEMQFSIIKGDCAGLLFNEDTKGQTFYELEVCQDGQDYSERQNEVKPSETKFLHKDYWSPSGVVDPWNTIDLVVNNNVFDLYINQQFISRVTDTTYTQGKIAVLASDEDQPTTEVAYRNASVWAPPVSN